MLIFIVAITTVALTWLVSVTMTWQRQCSGASREPSPLKNQTDAKSLGDCERPLELATTATQGENKTTTKKSNPRPMRIIVAMTGATGAVLGIRLLELLRDMRVESHLIISRWAGETMKYEGDYSIKDVKKLATFCYSHNDAAALPSSGSFPTDGMIVVPCSMRTLSAIRIGYADDLICRAADVTIKERRKLVLVARETPLSPIHLENMLALARLQNVIIFPPMPAFYTKPKSLEDIIDQSVGRMLDMFGLQSEHFPRWKGMGQSEA